MMSDSDNRNQVFDKSASKRTFRLSRRAFLRLGLLGVVGVLGCKGFINSRNLRLSELKIKLSALPRAFDGLKIGQITDIHAGPLVPRGLIREGVELIMAHRPDVIFLTGDFVSGATKMLWTTYGGFKKHHLRYCMEELRRLEAPLGLFAVLGNHDFWSGPKVATEIALGLKNIGVRVLRNESVTLEKNGQPLHVAGVDDYWEGSYSLAKAMEHIPNDTCRILLSHNPDVNQDIDLFKKHVDFIVSGHTHGGQIVLPLFGAPYLPSPFGQKYRAGLVTDGERKTFVSRGLGLFFVPVRLNCPPEVNLLVLSRR